MKPMRTQPYWAYATKALPSDSALLQVVSEYLGMRLHKNPNLHPKDWESCIDEVCRAFEIEPKTGQDKPRQRTIGKPKRPNLIPDLIYMFQVATSRKLIHVYMTPERDAAWNNMSFWQDPYWCRIVKNPETRNILKGELDIE